MATVAGGVCLCGAYGTLAQMHFYPRSCVPRSQRFGLGSQQVVVEQEVEASARAACDCRGCAGPQFPCLGGGFVRLHGKNHAWHVLSQWACLVKSQRWMGGRRQRSFQYGWRTGGRGRVLCEIGQRGGPAGHQSFSVPHPASGFCLLLWVSIPLSLGLCLLTPLPPVRSPSPLHSGSLSPRWVSVRSLSSEVQHLPC